MPYLETASNRFFYTRNRHSYDEESNTLMPLVLLHGAGGSHLDWPPALRLWPHGPVYALDLPGHGRTAPPGRDTIAAYAADVRQFLDRLQLPRIALMGHSMGGAIAQQLALQPPPELAALILLGTGARLRVAPAFLAGLSVDFAGTVAEISRYLWADGVPEPARAAAATRMRNHPLEIVRGDFLACDQFDFRSQLPQITLPTLVISGTADQMTPLKFGRYLAENLPQARLVTISGAGHMTAQEQPAAVATAVRDFLLEFT
jgi:pimeloyl-ACP methyl ester carboxylesterase